MEALERIRPTKTKTGPGRYDETITPGSGVTVYGHIRVHSDRTELSCEKHYDVVSGDIIRADSANYRVTSRVGALGNSMVQFLLERYDEPITP